MKRVIKLSFIILVFFSVSCSKDSDVSKNLSGTVWKHTYVDPYDELNPDDEYELLKFTSSKKVEWWVKPYGYKIEKSIDATYYVEGNVIKITDGKDYIIGHIDNISIIFIEDGDPYVFIKQ